ncbi:MAG: ATP-binding cassette domain-containing protein [Desulfovibrio sp.]|jgi:putative ABC transport system ATP-binding protein|nr:ATP-binding cassette domain-containing protein [Desulfovibrio sp.]
MDEIIFAVENVRKKRRQGAGYVLHIHSLRIARGEQIALTGASGSGKSTALDLLGMVLRPDEAEVCILNTPTESVDVGALWRGEDVDRMAALRLQYMGYVLQTGGLLSYLTVEENMGLTARMQGRPESFIKENVRALAAQLGISTLLKSMPSTLSVGERQRAAIGRSLAAQPMLVLADEPTAALDPVHAEVVMGLFRNAVTNLGASLVMVSHDLALVRKEGLREVRIEVGADDDGCVYAGIDDRQKG